MAMNIKDVELTIEPPNGAALAVGALKNAPYEIKEQISEHIEKLANRVASDAANRITRHPSNLWRKAGKARYLVKKETLLSARVTTPGGEVGKAEAITEFIRNAKSPQGKSLVSVLDKYYSRPGGSGGGRVLWAAWDAVEKDHIEAVQKIIDEAAANLESEVNAVG